MKNAFNRFAHIMLCTAACSFGLVAGCHSDNDNATLKDNSGSNLTTTSGQQITESMLVGKWDLDGERTNSANGHSGVTSIPSDITKDVLGKGWKFEPGGVLKTDQVVGSKHGTWRIEGNNTLVVLESPNATPKSYEASFRDGFLYLHRPDGTWMVFEKSKFFGF